MTNVGNDKNAPTDNETYYEKIASQQEVYLEETEEEVHTILTAEEQPRRTEQAPITANEDSYSRMADRIDEQLDRAAEDLITGDSDDAPVSEEAVAEMLRASLIARRLGPT